MPDPVYYSIRTDNHKERFPLSTFSFAPAAPLIDNTKLTAPLKFGHVLEIHLIRSAVIRIICLLHGRRFLANVSDVIKRTFNN